MYIIITNGLRKTTTLFITKYKQGNPATYFPHQNRQKEPMYPLGDNLRGIMKTRSSERPTYLFVRIYSMYITASHRRKHSYLNRDMNPSITDCSSNYY